MRSFSTAPVRHAEAAGAPAVAVIGAGFSGTLLALTSLPDIRQQCEGLAHQIAKKLHLEFRPAAAPHLPEDRRAAAT